MILGQNQYGKAECRVVRVTREPAVTQGDTEAAETGVVHRLKDLNVSIALSGDMDEVHLSGDNATVLPTDTTKNTVYAFAKEHGVTSAEDFGILLARHFVTSQEPIRRARVRIEEYDWERITLGDGGQAPHSFVRRGQETRLAQVTFDGRSWEVISGLKGLTVLNSTDSEFWGFVKDRYTTLKEAHDRVLATDVNSRWRYAWQGGDDRPAWDAAYAQARTHLLEAFAETYSLSLQQTLYAMGSRVIDGVAAIDEVRLSLPNNHHFLVDLEPFGLKNDNEVYVAADRPYGLIEATVLRDGAQARIPVDLTNL